MTATTEILESKRNGKSIDDTATVGIVWQILRKRKSSKNELIAKKFNVVLATAESEETTYEQTNSRTYRTSYRVASVSC